MSDVLNSQQLRLRPCAIADCINLHALWIEAEVRRFLFDDRQISLDEAHSLIEASLNSFAQHGYGVWLFFQQQHDEIAGFAGLLHSDGAALCVMNSERETRTNLSKDFEMTIVFAP